MLIESKADAVKRRKENRNKLKRDSKRQRRARRVLRRCQRSDRCGTEACSVCLRDFRLWWLGESIKILVQRPHWTRCSVIAKDLLVEFKKLAIFDIKRQVKRVQKQLQRKLGGRTVLGAFDVSLNVENNKIQGWQWHLYLLVEGENDEALQNAIRDAFPAEPIALVPYDFVLISHGDYVKVLTYLYKRFFQRRSGYTKSNGRHRTKNLPLKAGDLRQLLPFLVRHKVGSRLILSGVRRNGSRLAFTATKPLAGNEAGEKTAG